MDWMQFVSALVSALAWPSAVVLVVCLLKNPILGLIPKIRSLKYGDLHIDLGKELEAVKAEISDQAAETESPGIVPAPTTVELASLSPRSAVIISWRDVEREVDQALAAHQLKIAHQHMTHPGLKMRVLRDKNLIDENTMSTFKKMYGLRNRAVHLTDVEIGYSDAITMAELCEWLIQKLKEAQVSKTPANEGRDST